MTYLLNSHLMKKTKVLYCLTTRGLYSELFNLCLATIFCEKMGYKLCVNSFYWNAKIEKGWNDYFEPTLDSSNNPFSAQDKVYTNEKPWIGKIYYKPKEFFSFYIMKILNLIYNIFYPHHLLTKDIFEDMRSKEFIYDTLGKDAFNLMASSFKQLYILNRNTKDQLRQRIDDLGLPKDYISVHIRRGDKITSQEMQEIRIGKYVSSILDHKAVSSNVYIATDDVTIIDELSQQLSTHGIRVFYNNQNQSQGFNEATFNRFSRQARYEEMLNVLLDMEVLIHSRFFIGTYTSNLSRVVPFFLGLDKCTSLDNDWNIINSMNGM